MDRYYIVLELIEHPDKYTPDEVRQILADPEAREIYNLLCKTESAFKATEEISDDAVAEEWHSFSGKHFRRRFHFPLSGNRAASIAIIALTSLAAVAIGVALTMKVAERTPDPAEYSSSQIAAIDVTSNDTVTKKQIEGDPAAEPVLFEDETLANILKAVGATYGTEVNYRNADAAGLHLYYKFDPSLPLTEIVEQLNTFEQINIRIDGNTLIID